MTVRATRERRSGHGSDPWWGDSTAELELPATIEPRRSTRRAARRERRRSSAGWRLLQLALAPLRLLLERMRRSERMRRLGVRMAIVLVIVTFLACSVGVILINNVVIGRTAELGELDDRRRELRRDNALLGAQAAQLSSPPVVVRRAERELGMLRTTELPQFVYLVPGSRRLTPLQRRRVALREERQRRIEAQRAASTGGAAAPAGSTTTTEQAP